MDDSGEQEHHNNQIPPGWARAAPRRNDRGRFTPGGSRLGYNFSPEPSSDEPVNDPVGSASEPSPSIPDDPRVNTEDDDPHDINGPMGGLGGLRGRGGRNRAVGVIHPTRNNVANSSIQRVIIPQAVSRSARIQVSKPDTALRAASPQELARDCEDVMAVTMHADLQEGPSAKDALWRASLEYQQPGVMTLPARPNPGSGNNIPAQKISTRDLTGPELCSLGLAMALVPPGLLSVLKARFGPIRYTAKVRDTNQVDPNELARFDPAQTIYFYKAYNESGKRDTVRGDVVREVQADGSVRTIMVYQIDDTAAPMPYTPEDLEFNYKNASPGFPATIAILRNRMRAHGPSDAHEGALKNQIKPILVSALKTTARMLQQSNGYASVTNTRITQARHEVEKFLNDRAQNTPQTSVDPRYAGVVDAEIRRAQSLVEDLIANPRAMPRLLMANLTAFLAKGQAVSEDSAGLPVGVKKRSQAPTDQSYFVGMNETVIAMNRATDGLSRLSLQEQMTRDSLSQKEVDAVLKVFDAGILNVAKFAQAAIANRRAALGNQTEWFLQLAKQLNMEPRSLLQHFPESTEELGLVLGQSRANALMILDHLVDSAIMAKGITKDNEIVSKRSKMRAKLIKGDKLANRLSLFSEPLSMVNESAKVEFALANDLLDSAISIFHEELTAMAWGAPEAFIESNMVKGNPEQKRLLYQYGASAGYLSLRD